MAIAKRFVDRLRDVIRVEAVYLFGSRAAGRGGPYSDIDLVIVSPDFSGARFHDAVRLIPVVLQTDVGIEVHPFRPEDFDPQEDAFVAEIQTTGIRIV